jgi:hypothetical protein
MKAKSYGGALALILIAASPVPAAQPLCVNIQCTDPNPAAGLMGDQLPSGLVPTGDNVPPKARPVQQQAPSPVPAQSPPALVPLSQYSVTTKVDRYSVQYVAERCSGIYTAISKMLERTTSPEGKKAREINEAAAFYFYNMAMNMELTAPGYNATGRAVPTTVLNMANTYTDLMQTSDERTGDATADPIVNGDWDYCNTFRKTIDQQ